MKLPDIERLREKFKSVNTFLFDVDGTIVDSLPVYLESFNRAIIECGLSPLSKEELYNFLDRGCSLREILDSVFPKKFPEREKQIELSYNSIKKYFGEIYPLNLRLHPGVRDLFENLRKNGYKIGIITGRVTTEEFEKGIIEKLGLESYVDAIATSLETRKRKPNPEIIVACAKKLNVLPISCAVVGDSSVDIIAGKSAGSIAIGVLTGVGKRREMYENGADLVIESLVELNESLQILIT